MNPNDLLATADVATLYGVPESTLRFWRHQGRGPVGFKVGRRVRYRRGDVEAWLDVQRSATGAGDLLDVPDLTGRRRGGAA